MDLLLFVALLGSWAIVWMMIKEALPSWHIILRHAAGAVGGFAALLALGMTFAAFGLLKGDKKGSPSPAPAVTVEDTTEPKPRPSPSSPPPELNEVPATVPVEPKPTPSSPPPEPNEVHYTVTEDETRAPWKRSVEIQLDDRITERQLRWIDDQIMGRGTERVERTFIGYRLKGQPFSMYWATTHHNPSREVRIQGLSIEEFAKFLALEVPETMSGTLVGTWIRDVGKLSTLYVMYRKNGRLLMAQLTADGGEAFNVRLETKRVNRTLRFYEKGNGFGEYFTFDALGVMNMWDDQQDQPFDRVTPRDVPNAIELLKLR